ncbi:hypothetical protein [Streptosporangium sp. NPDC003464]
MGLVVMLPFSELLAWANSQRGLDQPGLSPRGPALHPPAAPAFWGEYTWTWPAPPSSTST